MLKAAAVGLDAWVVQARHDDKPKRRRELVKVVCALQRSSDSVDEETIRHASRKISQRSRLYARHAAMMAWESQE